MERHIQRAREGQDAEERAAMRQRKQTQRKQTKKPTNGKMVV
jgi:hypothetical protein